MPAAFRVKSQHRLVLPRWSVALVLAIGGHLAFWSLAEAVPSFARQTGLPCAACHNNFPQLTPLGRQFKMLGYEFDDSPNKYPPLSMHVQGSFTHTAAGQPGGAAPHFGDNDNFALDAVSLFYGGKILSRLAAFSQVTYDGVAEHLAIDNTDIRLANSFTIAEKPLLPIIGAYNPSALRLIHMDSPCGLSSAGLPWK